MNRGEDMGRCLFVMFVGVSGLVLSGCASTHNLEICKTYENLVIPGAGPFSAANITIQRDYPFDLSQVLLGGSALNQGSRRVTAFLRRLIVTPHSGVTDLSFISRLEINISAQNQQSSNLSSQNVVLAYHQNGGHFVSLIGHDMSSGASQTQEVEPSLNGGLIFWGNRDVNITPFIDAGRINLEFSSVLRPPAQDWAVDIAICVGDISVSYDSTATSHSG